MRNQLLVATLIPALVAGAASNPFSKKLAREAEAIHALTRLTYGPRPGDVEEVKKLGVEKWIEMQLEPKSVPEDPKLEASLKLLDSLTMTPRDMILHYPEQNTIQQAARGNAPMPNDPVLRARLERVAKKYKARMDGATPAAPKPMEQILDATELSTFRSGSPEERVKFLSSLSEEKFADVIEAMPPQMRQRLMFTGTPELRRRVMVNTQPQQIIINDLMEGKLLRAIYSTHQLEEVLVDFWYNHFNVFLEKGLDRVLVTSYERDAIRPYVLGKFKDMLQATAEHPAMSFYLDNWQSAANGSPSFGNQKRGLNENYARELLELHTLGVDGGYTQQDIIEVARCFTGWSLRQPRQGNGFQFIERAHDKGEKTVLGVKIPAGGGKEDGMKVLDILLHHPSTARFLSKKLAMRFVSDDPPKELIDRMAKTYKDTDGDLKAMMRSMFTSKEFWSEGAFNAKMKSPLEMVVSAVRATGAEVITPFSLVQQLQQLGQPLYRKIEPTGYSSANAEWTNSAALLARMNFALALAQNKVPGLKVDTSKFTKAAVADVIARELLFHESSPATRAALKSETEPQKIAGLVLGSPEFQRR